MTYIVTSTDIDQVRRMVDDVTTSGYSDATISGYLVTFDGDKHAVAGEIWGEKAAALQATTYDLSADNASYTYSQKIENAFNLAKYHNSKRLPLTSLWTKDPVEPDTNVFGGDSFIDENAIVNETLDESI